MTPAIKYVAKIPKIPRIMLYGRIDNSIFIPEDCEIPDKRKGTALGEIAYGYEPTIDAGCNHHFAYPKVEIEFAIVCTLKESQPISCGTAGYIKIRFKITSNPKNITLVRSENCIDKKLFILSTTV